MYKMSSWQNVSDWYSEIVGEKGHYYHQQIIIPNSLKLLNLTQADSLLDLACGQGVLARHLDKNIKYVGVDASEALVHQARSLDTNANHSYLVSDAAKSLNLNTTFTHVSIILALQNIKNQFLVIENAAKYLNRGGKLLIVLNHPAFRIPRQSSWEFDNKNNVQYRKINRYMSALDIPILTHPGEADTSQTTLSFHQPISYYADILSKNGFCIEKVEEWISNKTSVGKRAKAENTARKEFPLFMALLACKAE